MRTRARVAKARITLGKWVKTYWRRRPRNSVDPITFDRLHPPVFRHVDANGHVHAFDPVTLAAYFRASGNFCNPVTRDPLNMVELRRLQRLLPPSDDPPLTEVKAALELARMRDTDRENDYQASVLQIQLAFQEILIYCLTPHFRARQYRALMNGICLALESMAAVHGPRLTNDTIEVMSSSVINVILMLFTLPNPTDEQVAALRIYDTRILPDLMALTVFYNSGQTVNTPVTLAM